MDFLWLYILTYGRRISFVFFFFVYSRSNSAVFLLSIMFDIIREVDHPRAPYQRPEIEVYWLPEAHSLLRTFSLQGGLEDWTLADEEVEVTPENNLEWWQ